MISGKKLDDFLTKKLSDTGNRTQGYRVRGDNVSHYTISDYYSAPVTKSERRFQLADLQLGACPLATPHSTTMGKLNIAHHKSYHPYRADNIERVRRDEEEARLKEAQEDGRVMLAVSHFRSPSASTMD
jgi:hypothetical protein